MIWAKEETMSREEIEAIQLERLKKTVSRVYENVPAYRAKMDEAGVKPEDIQTLKDLRRLPFTTKQDMRDNYPYGLFAAPKKALRRIHASSGTTGKPTVVGYTAADLEVWRECVARLAVAGGGTISHRSALDMECLPAPWACTMDWRRWALLLFRPPRATRKSS